MGQKTHPYGFRLGVIKTWTSKWYEDKQYSTWLHEDLRIKRAVKDYLYNANVASVEVVPSPKSQAYVRGVLLSGSRDCRPSSVTAPSELYGPPALATGVWFGSGAPEWHSEVPWSLKLPPATGTRDCP